MHIFLYGMPGSGKSTIGAALAQALERPFLDLDAQIEAQGTSITELITGQGENAFRDLETSALKDAVAGETKVISLGGGALLREENRSLADSSGQVVVLDADLPTLLSRLSADSNKRPLLAGDPDTQLNALKQARQAHYDAYTHQIDASQPPEDVIWEIQRMLGVYRVGGMGAGYDARVQNTGLDHLGEMLAERGLGATVMVVSDSNVAPLYLEQTTSSLQASGFRAHSLVIPAGEAHKTLETVSSLWQGFLQAGLDRSSTVIALGGGVVGDLAGFAAATFMRGIPWVNLPTTLLAMIDAAIGGKTGFDLPEGKNLVGAFHPPRLVLADLDTLHTLPEVELRSGMAEVVKHGVIADPALFELCALGMEAVRENLGRIVRQGLAVKVKIIQDDPYEKGIRGALNLGHTIGHAVELVSGFDLRHGEAVAIGMVAEARLAERLSLAEAGLSETISNALQGLGLPVAIPENLPRPEIIQAMKMDKKKAAGIVRFSLPVRIGEVRVGVEIENLEEVL